MAKKKFGMRSETQAPNMVASEHALELVGEKILKAYHDQLHKDGVAGELLNTWFRWEKEGDKWLYVLYLPSYWYWEEHGRGPGKIPPPKKIEEWLRFKGQYMLNALRPDLPPIEEKDIPCISWGIAINIGKNGVEGKHSMEKVFDEHPEFLDEVVSAIVNVDIDQSLIDAFDDDSLFDV